MEALVVFIIFFTIFAIAYLYFSTRNKERLALIEKGADASIFVSDRKGHSAPGWKVFVLNIALLLMGIGSGIIVGGILSGVFHADDDIVLPGSIFLFAGTGLLVGFFLTKKMDKE